MRGPILVALALWSASGFAWGPEGHRLVARMAEEELTPAAADRVRATLAPGESLAALASWADEVRTTRKKTDPWHFIDIPIDSAGLDMQRDCPKADCVLAKIAEFRRRWRDDAVSAAERREALLFLVHFVGDMHQPLHCANNNDRGGNDLIVEFEGQRMNLHRVWDSGLLDRMPAEETLFAALSHAITSSEQAEWSRGGIETWAAESFAAARDVVYGGLPRGSGSPQLGAAYEQKAETVVEIQLEKAAVRLAAILNEMP